jgi:putative transposase
VIRVKKKRFSEEQIVRILHEGDKGGKTILDLCRRHGVTEQTFYRWRRRFAGMQVPEVQQFRHLQQENARLKKLLAERDLEIESMTELLKKKW